LDTITENEAKELNVILKEELDDAKETNDVLAVLAILFLLGAVTIAIASFS